MRGIRQIIKMRIFGILHTCKAYLYYELAISLWEVEETLSVCSRFAAHCTEQDLPSY